MEKVNNTISTLIENLKTSDDKQRSEIINNLSEDYNNAIPMLWIEAVNQDNPRAILSVIRDILKKEKPRGIFKRSIGNSKEKLSGFLQHSDAKTRKNVCGIIGELGDPTYLEALYSAYESEPQLFVKSSYVLAIGNCGDEEDAKRLQIILESLILKEKAESGESLQVSNIKHINEEKLALSKVIAKLSPPVKHEFKGFENPVPMILTSMNDQFYVTLMDLKQKSIEGAFVNEGILIKEKDVNKVYTCRTFYELLYPLDNCKNLQLDYKVIATAVLKADIVGFLNQCHVSASNTAFGYRIEFKSDDFNRERSDFVKNLSRELDEHSGGYLKNSPSSYEVEIRILEKNNLCAVYIKLYSFKDNRFAYREKILPTSINPVTSAIVMKAISKWLKPASKVIDPFCGTATMLIERAKSKEFGALTGVDIFRSGISAATINSSLANVDIELIAEDILEFSTLNPFDELITNMPFDNNPSNFNSNVNLYIGFVDKIPELIRSGGMVFLYTVEKKLLKETLVGNTYLELLDEIKIESGNLTPHVFVLRVK